MGRDVLDIDLAKDKAKIARLTILTTLNRLSFSFKVIVLPLFALAIGETEAFYGVLVASAGYVQSVVLFPAGHISDRYGRGISILIGGLLSGVCLLLIPFNTNSLIVLILYAATGIGGGFVRTSIDTLVADYTKSGDDRTKSYGYTIGIATLAGIVGPFLGGLIIDENALPGIEPVIVRYMILFFMMGGFRIASGIVGLWTERWLKGNFPEVAKEKEKQQAEEDIIITDDAKEDAKTATLFGIGQAIMGFSSGMVVPYLIPWIYAAFNPDPVILGSIPAVSSLTLASGTLFVGLSSEKVGKLKMIFGLYLLVPLLTIGMVYIPIFLVMIVFYVSRMAVANMARPAYNSLFMSQVSSKRRGRSLASTRIMWTFPRQTGTLFTAFLLSIGFLGGIVSFGVIFFPIAFALYPFTVIPMWLAVRRNKKNSEKKKIHEESVEYSE